MSDPVCQGCGESLPPTTWLGRDRKWCSERCRKAQHNEREACVDCGGPTKFGARNGYSKTGIAPRCQACTTARTQAEWAPYRRMVEEMWAEGLTARQIGEALGWEMKNPGARISTLRSRGYDLPRRYSDDRIATCVLNGESLRKARAAKVTA